MKKIFISLLLLSQFSFANELVLWNAHPERGHSVDKRLKLVLSIIRDQKLAVLGKTFMKLDSEFQKTIFYNFLSIPHFVKSMEDFDPKSFSSEEKFKKRFKIFSFYTPDKNRTYRLSNEKLIQQIFVIKEMTESIRGYYETADDSLNDSIDRGNQQFNKLIEEIASGDLNIIGLNVKVPSVMLSLMGRALTGKSVKEVLTEDILEIVSPGKDPTSSTDQNYNLEGTSAYLANLVLANRNILDALIKVVSIQSISEEETLFSYFQREFNLSSLDSLRLINLANHNHGLEYYLLNGLIDLTQNEAEAIDLVKKAMFGLNQLYKLIDDHEKRRERVSSQSQDQLKRKYHFWGGALVSCELIDRGYNSFLAEYISTKLGELYESFGNKTIDEESKNDILLHKLGANFATNVCNTSSKD